MKKQAIQIIIVIIGIVTTSISTSILLRTPTMILSPLFLVGLYLPIIFILALFFGFLTKQVLKSSWHTLTFTAVNMTVICFTYSVSQFKSSYEIVIPNNYVGEVKLLLSNEKENDFTINNYGIGYISETTFKNGFRPKIIKNGQDISKKVTEYSKSSFLSNTLSVDYLSFLIDQKVESS